MLCWHRLCAVPDFGRSPLQVELNVSLIIALKPWLKVDVSSAGSAGPKGRDFEPI